MADLTDKQRLFVVEYMNMEDVEVCYGAPTRSAGGARPGWPRPPVCLVL
jgi:hypothetical protein